MASSFHASGLPSEAAWQDEVACSDVRLQWDPDHAPSGQPVERRAVQLGLRRGVLAQYARPWIVRIEDVSPLVAEQREQLRHRGPDALIMPREEVYPVPAAARPALGMPLT